MKFAVAVSSTSKSDLVSIGGVEVSVSEVVGTGVAIADEQSSSNAESATKNPVTNRCFSTDLYFVVIAKFFLKVALYRCGVHRQIRGALIARCFALRWVLASAGQDYRSGLYWRKNPCLAAIYAASEYQDCKQTKRGRPRCQ